jgi:quercetin dioxygenase-like cupin family protein
VSRSSMPDAPSSDGHLPQSLQDALACAVRPLELSAKRRERLRRRILKRARDQTSEGTRTLRATEGDWIEIRPFVEVRELRRDEASGMHTSLLRMRPGGVIPAHRHEREEECIVLEGEVQIGTHTLSAGDVHIAAAGTWHEQVSTRKGVLVLLRGDDPHPTSSQPSR